jgi:hypothetical protein
MPTTSMWLGYDMFNDRISKELKGIYEMFDNKSNFIGRTILISGCEYF